MSEERFYRHENYICARCGEMLEWRKRRDLADSMILLHSGLDCRNSGKAFYPPAHQFTEIPPEIMALQGINGI